MSWFDHVHWTINDRMIKKWYELKPISPRLAGRPKIRWENDINEDLKIMAINKWTKFVHGWITRKEVVEKAMTFKQWICSAWSRRRRRKRKRVGPRASCLKKALHCKIFMVSYLQFVERKHLYTGAFSTGCGASNAARKLSR